MLQDINQSLYKEEIIMEEIKKLTLPLTSEQIKELKAGDKVEISGIMYTGRDAAHKRLVPPPPRG